jgi:hypothetical protein
MENNNPGNPRPKAVVLVSGGLDSMLTIKVLERAGVETFPVHYSIGFGVAAVRKQLRPQLPNNSGIDMMRERGVDVKVVDISEEYYYNVILRPKHGYGSQINPCIDCKIFMLGKAWEYANEIGAEFIATGEVVGQRPMSQRRPMLLRIVNEAGLAGKVLRPLSAKKLPITDVEKSGAVSRDSLYGIEGRGRLTQFAMAKEFGLERYENPAGGCLLTDPDIATRAWEMFRNEPKAGIGFHEFETVKVGTHVRLSPKAKLIVGRNFYDNIYVKELLPKIERDAYGLDAEDIPGPFGIVFGEDAKAFIPEAVRVVARYADKRTGVPIRVVDKSGKEIETLTVDAYTREEVAPRIITKENFRAKR